MRKSGLDFTLNQPTFPGGHSIRGIRREDRLVDRTVNRKSFSVWITTHALGHAPRA